ncbi:MAG: dihydroneopterin aldolase [Nitrospira sp.]|nr:dihydroneopterin aldolase [Nitrospira sp.]MDH5193490.1 dihydroneopterin aldolase [Nitrospira sp.]
MPDQIRIERLEFRARCGVTVEERARLQPLAVDLELDCRMDHAGLSDDLRYTIDYATVARRVVEIGTSREAQLLESIVEQLFVVIFSEFPVDRIKIWLRKLHPPIVHITTSVGITCERTRVAQTILRADPRPARFLVQQLHRLPKGTVLDVAAGRGRHTLFLSSLGYQVEAIDRDEQALAQLMTDARSRHLADITIQALDLESPPPPTLGKDRYDAILVFLYLARPIFPPLIHALKPGGVLVYETFLIDHHLHYQHPRRREFCLGHGELLTLTSGLRVLHYDEGLHEGARDGESAYTAQLVAQKPFTPGASA